MALQSSGAASPRRSPLRRSSDLPHPTSAATDSVAAPGRPSLSHNCNSNRRHTGPTMAEYRQLAPDAAMCRKKSLLPFSSSPMQRRPDNSGKWHGRAVRVLLALFSVAFISLLVVHTGLGPPPAIPRLSLPAIVTTGPPAAGDGKAAAVQAESSAEVNVNVVPQYNDSAYQAVANDIYRLNTMSGDPFHLPEGAYFDRPLGYADVTIDRLTGKPRHNASSTTHSQRAAGSRSFGYDASLYRSDEWTRPTGGNQHEYAAYQFSPFLPLNPDVVVRSAFWDSDLRLLKSPMSKFHISQWPPSVFRAIREGRARGGVAFNLEVKYEVYKAAAGVFAGCSAGGDQGVSSVFTLLEPKEINDWIGGPKRLRKPPITHLHMVLLCPQKRPGPSRSAVQPSDFPFIITRPLDTLRAAKRGEVDSVAVYEKRYSQEPLWSPPTSPHPSDGDERGGLAVLVKSTRGGPSAVAGEGLDERRIMAWLAHMRGIGVTQIYVYVVALWDDDHLEGDGESGYPPGRREGSRPTLRLALDERIERLFREQEGFVTIVPFPQYIGQWCYRPWRDRVTWGPWPLTYTYCYAEGSSVQDVIYRFRWSHRAVILIDLDEYFLLPLPSNPIGFPMVNETLTPTAFFNTVPPPSPQRTLDLWFDRHLEHSYRRKDTHAVFLVGYRQYYPDCVVRSDGSSYYDVMDLGTLRHAPHSWLFKDMNPGKSFFLLPTPVVMGLHYERTRLMRARTENALIAHIHRGCPLPKPPEAPDLLELIKRTKHGADDAQTEEELTRDEKLHEGWDLVWPADTLKQGGRAILPVVQRGFSACHGLNGIYNASTHSCCAAHCQRCGPPPLWPQDPRGPIVSDEWAYFKEIGERVSEGIGECSASWVRRNGLPCGAADGSLPCWIHDDVLLPPAAGRAQERHRPAIIDAPEVEDDSDAADADSDAADAADTGEEGDDNLPQPDEREGDQKEIG
ncbi:unnamed protein product [Vitrella brassicaformis CCMP3155]|uniref:Glycosyltransferase family 92 protein n=3 Tax=Vitrella brassicaformis TaxID=1169539 RepID=A0A0G4EKV4_VITBC|nr:unnamed protein product [Vitrella brassicaformis CCMP3155]|eukprot:CEL97801.1 unnamed protein product [Vitrella brassicaformis CCMP3155]